jgi:hypothetical protein
MSKINQKPNWQTKNDDDSYHRNDDDFEYVEEQMNEKNTIDKETTKQTKDSNQTQIGLDTNLIISCFQEKLSQLTTELVVKEATIKQLTIIINSMKGNQLL